MKYLLDANVFREIGKTKPHENVRAWLASVDDADLAISALTVREVANGIGSCRHFCGRAVAFVANVLHLTSMSRRQPASQASSRTRRMRATAADRQTAAKLSALLLHRTNGHVRLTVGSDADESVDLSVAVPGRHSGQCREHDRKRCE